MKDIETREVSAWETGLIAGFGIFFLLVIYFMIMRYCDFMHSELAWCFNFIILFVGMIETYIYYRSKTKPIVDYIPGLMLGCVITCTSVIPFGLFVYGYFALVSPALLSTLKDNTLFMGEPITPIKVAISTLAEGVSSGVVMTFIIMQYYKAGFKRQQNETMG